MDTICSIDNHTIPFLETLEECKSTFELYSYINNHFYGNPNDCVIAFCSKCGEQRRMTIKIKTFDEHTYYKYPIVGPTSFNSKNSEPNQIHMNSFPIIFSCTCLQCDSHVNVIAYLNQTKEISYAFLYDTYTGSTTPNTPDEIKYYLTEAFKCRSIGSYSAAIAMYRSALEWLMQLHGYKDGMLGSKISKLFSDVKDKKEETPSWALNIPQNFLDIIKNLGNQSIHTNNGNIEIQDKMNIDLIKKVDLVFKLILELAYEQPQKFKELTEQFDKLK